MFYAMIEKGTVTGTSNEFHACWDDVEFFPISEPSDLLSLQRITDNNILTAARVDIQRRLSPVRAYRGRALKN